jgi:hypothetical protein
MDSMAESIGCPQAKKRKIIASPSALNSWPAGNWPPAPLDEIAPAQGVAVVFPGELVAIPEPDPAAAANNNVVT